MPTQLLTFGVALPMQTNVVYALPSHKCVLFCADTTPAIEQSAVFDFSTKAAINVSAGKTDLAGLFIRATAGNPLIVLNQG